MVHDLTVERTYFDEALHQAKPFCAGLEYNAQTHLRAFRSAVRSAARSATIHAHYSLYLSL